MAPAPERPTTAQRRSLRDSAADAGRVRVARIIEHLAGGTRKAQHHLEQLGNIWIAWALRSCFWSPRYPPALGDLDVVAAFVGARHTPTALAALYALEQAGRCARIRPGALDTIHRSAVASRAVIDAVTDRRAKVRISASRCLATDPSRRAVPALTGALADPVWTVRWNAVRALAPWVEHAPLRAVLTEARPRPAVEGQADHSVGHRTAWAALEPVGRG